MMWIVLTVILVLLVVTLVLLNHPSFGRAPRGERLERIKRSPHFKEGRFRNITPTKTLSSDKSWMASVYEFVFLKVKDLRPVNQLPAVKTDLKSLDVNVDMLVWLGHSSCYMQLNGKRLLLDPVLVMASPVSFLNRAFDGADIYRPEDIPDIDYLLLTHDHWDHLDYNVMLNLKSRTGKVICPLGVGEHLEYWGFAKDRITELDWNETTALDNGLVVNALPARHFSGRGLWANRTLWTAYMLQRDAGNIFICGDTGYDTHFAEIKKRFGYISFAIMENGQYNTDWKHIHLLPDDLVRAVKELDPGRFFTVHNSKFALAKHAWYEPLDNIANAAEAAGLPLITPMIGEPVYLNDTTQTFRKWWRLE